jgi:DNA polymerase III sliding clamp (beta) subunit (PCNA family)
MTDDENKRVVFTFSKEMLTLQARGAQAGRSKVEMPIDWTGDTLAMGVDPKSISDMLKVLKPRTPLTLDVTDPNTSAVFRQDPTYLYVVVPLVTTA